MYKVVFFLLIVASLALASNPWYAAYEYDDKVPPSQNPPGGLNAKACPQFITIGFDDNSYSGDKEIVSEYADGEAVRWALNFFKDLKNPAGSGNKATFDAAPCRVAFYLTSYYVEGYNGDNPALVRRIINEAFRNGHEVGNHTHSHGENLKKASKAQWKQEMEICNGWLQKPLAPDSMPLWQQAESKNYGSAIPLNTIVGFRTPFLAYGGDVFPCLKELNFVYDCTIEEGYHESHDGTNFRWPYTLDNGSPGHDESWQGNPSNPESFKVVPTPGLWELPNHVAMVPTDEECAQLGVNHSIGDNIKKSVSWFDKEARKFTMFDYNLWCEAKLPNEDVLAILKYNLNKRYNGNRAPLMIGAHSEYFSSKKSVSCPNATDVKARQKVFEDFIAYALTLKDVRVVRPIDIISWCRTPAALNNSSVITNNGVYNKQSIGIATLHNKTIIIATQHPLRITGTVYGDLYSLSGKKLHSLQSKEYNDRSISLRLPENVSHGCYYIVVQSDNLNQTFRLTL